MKQLWCYFFASIFHYTHVQCACVFLIRVQYNIKIIAYFILEQVLLLLSTADMISSINPDLKYEIKKFRVHLLFVYTQIRTHTHTHIWNSCVLVDISYIMWMVSLFSSLRLSRSSLLLVEEFINPSDDAAW